MEETIIPQEALDNLKTFMDKKYHIEPLDKDLTEVKGYDFAEGVDY